VTDLQTAGEPEGSAASLASAVLDEEAARQAAQARAREPVIFPDDLLPGVNSDPVDFREAFGKGGVYMFVVLGLLISFDQLTLNAVQTIEPELRRTFHISSGAVVFITAASSLFYALGALPLGWLADRTKRVPIVGVATLVAALFTFLSGLAGSAFVFFWCVCITGVAKANNIAVHQPLLADNYPIGIRARMSAVMNTGQQVLGNISPVVVGAIATWAGGAEGWRWAFFVLGIPGAILGIAAFFMREPPRGQFEKDDVLGEVIEDDSLLPVRTGRGWLARGSGAIRGRTVRSSTVIAGIWSSSSKRYDDQNDDCTCNYSANAPRAQAAGSRYSDQDGWLTSPPRKAQAGPRGACGRTRSFQPISAGVRSPFTPLQRRQQATRLAQATRCRSSASGGAPSHSQRSGATRAGASQAEAS
jgi:hypothetical protein